MGLLSTKENKDDLFSKILIYFDISITHPLQTAYKKYYASNGFGKVGSFFRVFRFLSQLSTLLISIGQSSLVF